MIATMAPPAVARLISTASGFAGLRDDGDAIPAPFADAIRRRVGATGSGRWDTALVYHWGFWSQYDFCGNRSQWPLPPSAEAEQLARFAEARGALRQVPEPGDIFLQWSPAQKAFVRSGVVAHVYRDTPETARYWSVLSIEGGSGSSGQLDGNRVNVIVRRLYPEQGDRFIRWTVLAEDRP